MRSQFLNQITFLALEGQPELASPAIHNILAMMHSEKLAMPNLVIPGLKLHMGHFANVNWQGLVVKEGEFGCDDKGREVIKNWKDGDERIGLCTVMRDADLRNGSFRDTRFEYVDLRNAKFHGADLSFAEFENSTLREAKFLDGIGLRGTKVDSSDFSHARFRPRANLRCALNENDCVELSGSNFSNAVMAEVEFDGVKIEGVDFSYANLTDAEFECDSAGRKDVQCPVLDEVCLQGTDLSDATFMGSEDMPIMIMNTDLSSAILADTKFFHVHFRNVLFPENFDTAAELDEPSTSSFERARKLGWDRDVEKPCDEERRRKRNAWWRDRFGLGEP
ncbi:MAG: pentapeptide repeat-containing protein [Boseongicola sp. SB0673_bin_14]|nr:pentapeptide repeat-containing protein [Boseongicola sp. SB0673_bin_14]